MLFSTPVQYVNQSNILEPIDSRLTNIKNYSYKKEEYIYQTASSDIMSYYSKFLSKEKGIVIKNNKFKYQFGIMSQKELFSKYSDIKTFIGRKRKGVVYNEAFGKNTFLQSYPTQLGTRNEVILTSPRNNEFSFWINAEDLLPTINSEGQILLASNELDKDGNTIIAGIVQPPLLTDKDGNLSDKNYLTIEKVEEKLYTIKVVIDKAFLTSKSTRYPVKFDICFEMRKEKQPDTQVFSNKPTVNKYLTNYTIIGHHPEYGDSRSYIRYQFFNNFEIRPEQVKSVKYYTYNLSKPFKNTHYINLYQVIDDWCSLTMNWNSKIRFDQKIFSTPLKYGVNAFDITDIAKTYLIDKDGNLQRKGLLMKSDENSYNIFTSSDSTLYPIRTEIVFK